MRAIVSVVLATALPGQDLATIDAAIEEEVQRFRKKGPTAEELNRIRTTRRADFIRGLARTMLSYDIIDRIRANPVGLNADNYDSVPPGPAGGYPDCIGATCTPAEMASYDVGTWKDALTAQLGPTADAEINTVGEVRTIGEVAVMEE